MEFLDILNAELRTRSVIDYRTMKKANNNNVINFSFIIFEQMVIFLSYFLGISLFLLLIAIK